MDIIIFIRYIMILGFTFLNLLLLKRILFYYDINFKYLIKFILFFVFTTIIAYIYRYSVIHHLEANMKVSRAIFIFLEIIYFLSFISFLLSLLYLKIYSSYNKNKSTPEVISDDKYEAQGVVCEQPLNKKEETTTRREFIKKGAFIFPIASIAFTSKGVFDAYSSPLYPQIKLKFKDLPESLIGLKIAQISDLHLGIFITLNYLQNIINELKKQNIDLLLLTGDFVDEYRELDDSVKILTQIKPKYGIYSSPGNHEYHRGIRPVLKAFKKYKIPYFISKGKRIKINNDYLFVGGIDDSNAVKSKYRKGYLKKSLEKTLKYSEKDDFKILMSHRYNVFDDSIKNNINLTLSGHSHGGQIGFNGRSLFQGIQGHKYLWGKYQEKNSTLYVTSGAGHWFPFRINCPTEVPVFTLERD